MIMSTPFKSKSAKKLYEALLSIKDTKSYEAFLTDLCTPKEIKDLSERWEIANLLYYTDMSYRDISAKTGASTTTVARVARFLKNEPHQGYTAVLKSSEK